ncbi:hypothetical protein BDB00DRAFT_162267 [Zychaea mexicana]|uniref:uncharacterized protein n=1 Tax=Zychaea mexicana TaxID=64656 RepID=UPI0022FE6F1C|nr:uncharacterized protein BDB00DRAFT_162267 [Zychaea mexicana]KAI9496082.1 hypothetical protein BDB00DRAFT_162267 [Zychaea mexicana]
MNSNQDKRSRDSQPESQETILSKRRRNSLRNGSETGGAAASANQEHAPISNSEPDQLAQDIWESSSSGSESGSESSSESDSSSGSSDSDSDDQFDTEEILVDAIQDVSADNANDNDNDRTVKQQEPATVPITTSAAPTSEHSLVPDATDSSSSTAATTTITTEDPREFVDQSIRRLTSNSFFFTRDAYEAYSVHSFHNTVQRHIQWIKEHKEEASAMYSQYVQLPQQQQPATSTQEKRASSSSPPATFPIDTTTDTRATTTANPPDIQRVSRTPSSSAAGTPRASSPVSLSSRTTTPPPPSSPSTTAAPQEKQKEIGVLDNLLSSIYSETKSTSPPLTSPTERQPIAKPPPPPSDISVAAAASSSTAPQSMPRPNVFLGDAVADIYQSLCKLDRGRIHHYPQHYAHHSNPTVRVPETHGKVPVLEFKKNIAKFGEIGTTTATGDYPQKIDMNKNYIQSDSSSSMDDQEYYRKKLPPPVSQDPIIPPILANNKIDITITLDTLSKLIELPNNMFLEFEIPIVVRDNENGNWLTTFILILYREHFARIMYRFLI